MGVDATTSGWSPGVVKQHIVRMIDKIFSGRLVSPWCSEKIAEYHTALRLTNPSVMYNGKLKIFHDHLILFKKYREREIYTAGNTKFVFIHHMADIRMKKMDSSGYVFITTTIRGNIWK